MSHSQCIDRSVCVHCFGNKGPDLEWRALVGFLKDFILFQWTFPILTMRNRFTHSVAFDSVSGLLQHFVSMGHSLRNCRGLAVRDPDNTYGHSLANLSPGHLGRGIRLMPTIVRTHKKLSSESVSPKTDSHEFAAGFKGKLFGRNKNNR